MVTLLTERWPQMTAGSATDAGQTASGDDGDGDDAQRLLAEMAALIRDTRSCLVVSGAVAAAVLIGLATEAALVPAGGPGPGTVAAGALYVLVALCLLRTLVLIVLAGLPLGQGLSQQRVSSGAPLDPRAPWASVPPPGTFAEPWGWTRAHLLLGQARFRAERIQSATAWACITTVAFLACTAVVLLAR